MASMRVLRCNPVCTTPESPAFSVGGRHIVYVSMAYQLQRAAAARMKISIEAVSSSVTTMNDLETLALHSHLDD